MLAKQLIPWAPGPNKCQPQPAGGLTSRQLIDAVGDAIVATDANGIILEWNRAAEAMFGWPREEAIGRSVAETIIPPEHREAHQAGLARFLRTGRARILDKPMELPALRRDGNRIPVNLRVKAIASGSTFVFIAVLPDLTQWKARDMRLRQLSQVVEQCPASVVITDREGAIEYVNPKFIELTGYSLEEVRGRNPRLLKSGKMPPEVYTQLWQTITAGHTWRGQLQNKKKDGQLYWIAASISPLTNAQGEITHFVGVGEDITHQRQVEQALKERESRYRALFESSTDAIMLLDEKGFLDCNAATLNIFGLASKDEFIGTHPAELSPPRQPDGTDSWTAAQDKIRTALAEGTNKFEWMHRRKGGEDFAAEVWLTAFQLDGRRILQANVRDISRRVRAEREREEMHQRMLEVSRQAGMAEIANGVLHNVGNVLNSINVATSLITEKVKKSQLEGLDKAVALMREHQEELGTFITRDERGRHLPKYLQLVAEQLQAERWFVLQELDGLRQQLEHVQEVIQMQQSYGRLSGAREAIDLTQLVDDALRLNDASFMRHNIEVVRQYEPVPAVVTEKHKLLQILVNLIGNAKHALREAKQSDRRLTLRVAPAEKGVMIQVEDNGVGIAPEHLDRIFEHGFTTKKDGHGFGLHSSRQAAEALGGTLTAHSDGPGLGAVFALTLPVQSSAATGCGSEVAVTPAAGASV